MMSQLTSGLLLLTAAASVAAAVMCPAHMCGAQEFQLGVCPTATSARSDPVLALKPHNLYMRNAASHSAEILYVQKDGSEVSYGLLTPGGRREFASLYGDVWRARAVRPGKAGNGALMLEHQVSAVEVKNCECPQPEFNDCAKPPFKGPRWTKSDPVVFQNRAGLPMDMFFWNGTCEELISWNDVGGMQPLQRKAIESTQGHTFRFRDAATRRLLMQHTLSDLVLRGCDDGSAETNAESVEALREAVSELDAEGEALRETLALELASLVSSLRDLASNKSAALPSADWHEGAWAEIESLAPLRAAAGAFGQLSRFA